MYSKREACTLCFILICVIMQILVFAYIIFYSSVFISTMRLQKVVILSRHNIRTPLSKNLQKTTPNTWPEWKERPGFLTAKGYKLEGYFGEYFSTYLAKEGLIGNCPSEEDFYVYANSLERTMSSASAFVKTAFPNCNITIHHSDFNKPDPIFAPYIHNTTESFKDIALKEMQEALEKLQISYDNLEEILDYNNSDFCKVNNDCDLNKDKNIINIEAGKKPKLSGPLKISNEVVDAFLMAYYSGFDSSDVAWGQLNDTKDWNSILNLSSAYHNTTYKTSHIAYDIARPLINYLKNVFLNDTKKVTLLMGHDANINVLLKSMSFKSYFLKDNFIPTPVGGKIVFEKWLDRSTNEFLLKIKYVYQSNEQLREGMSLSMDRPPQIVVLELESCIIDKQGFCLWDDFVMFLKDL